MDEAYEIGGLLGKCASCISSPCIAMLIGMVLNGDDGKLVALVSPVFVSSLCCADHHDDDDDFAFSRL